MEKIRKFDNNKYSAQEWDGIVDFINDRVTTENVDYDTIDKIATHLLNEQINTNNQIAEQIERDLQGVNLSSRNLSSVEIKEDAIVINRHAGGLNYVEYTLKNNTNVSEYETPYKLVRRKIFKVEGYLTVPEAVKAGNWGDINTANPADIVAHTSTRSFSTGDTLTFTATFGGTLELIYVGDSDGGYMDITIDGGDPIRVDTYSPQINHYRQHKTIASGIAYGEHTIVVISTGEKNPDSSNDQVWFNAFRIFDPNATPRNNLGKIKTWKSGENIPEYTEIIGSNGSFYVSTSSGVTGANEPVHQNGTVSDGGVDWLRIAQSSFDISENIVQDEGSELEHAYQAKYNNGAFEDYGGNLHGNEFLQVPFSIFVDGDKIENAIGTYAEGSTIELRQKIIGFSGDYSTKVDVMDTSQSHIFKPDFWNLRTKFKQLQPLEFGYFYVGMMPYLPYHGSTGQRIQFTKMWTPQESLNLMDYDGLEQSVIVGKHNDFIGVAEGVLYRPRGSQGVPSNDPGLNKIYLVIRSTPESVDNYQQTTLNFGLAPNTNSGTFTGTSSLLAKFYISRYSSGNNVVHPIDTTFEVSNKFYEIITPLDD